jgi:RND family efflux transporter MFP subunit
MYLKCIAIGLSALMLSGCGGEEPEAPPPSSRPVKIFVVSGGAADAIRTFPGREDASQRAELAFRVPGQLQQILVKEGDLVEAGQVLARLDPADYQIALEDVQASFDNAQRNFERGKELIVDGNISRTDYDRMEANYRSSSAALSQAELNLEYTVMTAPFRGRIARRNVENFEDVLARQSIFSLQNVEELEVIIDLPESVVRSIRGDVSEEAEIASSEKTSTVDAKATFEGRDQHVFTLTPKEIATQADAQTQTFRTTFRMEAPTSFTVLPGMTASVQLDLSTLVSEDSIKWVPTRAVQADSGLEARVWVLDPDTMTVSSRAVSIGRLSGRMIEVNDGLEGGEEIVSVGAPYLAEGMRVTRMLASEQAEPRADDPA